MSDPDANAATTHPNHVIILARPVCLLYLYNLFCFVLTDDSASRASYGPVMFSAFGSDTRIGCGTVKIDPSSLSHMITRGQTNVSKMWRVSRSRMPYQGHGRGRIGTNGRMNYSRAQYFFGVLRCTLCFMDTC